MKLVSSLLLSAMFMASANAIELDIEMDEQDYRDILKFPERCETIETKGELTNCAKTAIIDYYGPRMGGGQAIHFNQGLSVQYHDFTPALQSIDVCRDSWESELKLSDLLQPYYNVSSSDGYGIREVGPDWQQTKALANEPVTEELLSETASAFNHFADCYGELGKKLEDSPEGILRRIGQYYQLFSTELSAVRERIELKIKGPS